MKITCILSFVFPLVLLGQSLAQNFEEDFKKVAEKYTSGNYTLEVDHTFYGGHEETVPLDHQTSFIKKDGNNFHTLQFGTEIITDEDKVLIIDHANKVLIINKKHQERLKEEKEKAKEQIGELYRQLYAALGIDPEQVKTKKEDIKTTYLGHNKGLKGYRFSFAYGEYEHMEFYFNTKSHLIAEVWMFYRQPMEIEAGVFKKPKTQLVYKKQNTNPKFGKEEFNIKKYLKISAKGEVEIANENLKDFELINRLAN